MDEPKQKHAGEIKVYYPLKGYGFITRPKGKDVFFYRKDITDEAALLTGNRVRFFLEQTDRGPRAIAIERLG